MSMSRRQVVDGAVVALTFIAVIASSSGLALLHDPAVLLIVVDCC